MMPAPQPAHKIQVPHLRPLPSSEVLVKPSYKFEKLVEHQKGGNHNPVYWPLSVAGYPFVDAVIYVKGAPSQEFYILIDYAMPGVFEFQITNLGEGTTDSAGYGILQLQGYRPMMPDFTLIVTSMANSDFDTIAATLYATMA